MIKISQKEKDKYKMISLICDVQRNKAMKKPKVNKI